MTQRAPYFSGVPRRAWPVDLLTWVHSPQNSAAQTSPPIGDRDIRNPAPKPPNLELRFWANGLPPGVIAQTPPLPIRDRDIRNPLPEPPNLELRFWANGLPPGIVALTLPQRKTEWPNPVLAEPNLDLRTWTHSQISAPVAMPFSQTDWPVPLAETPSIDLKFWAHGLPPGALAFTVPPNQYDWPNPTLRTPNLELRTWVQQPPIQPTVVLPFNQTDWPVPRGRKPLVYDWAWPLDLAAITVSVPNVVGETQALATTDITAVGLGVSAITAYSDTVAAGLVISQSPLGGSTATIGDIVLITVSLGAFVPPAPSTDEPAGGWGFWVGYEAEQRRRLDEKRKREQLEEETEAIEEDIDRDIAKILREQEAQDARRAELDRLGDIARRHADAAEARVYSERVAVALERAIAKGTFSALEALDREIERAQTEEELVMVISQFIAQEDE